MRCIDKLALFSLFLQILRKPWAGEGGREGIIEKDDKIAPFLGVKMVIIQLIKFASTSTHKRKMTWELKWTPISCDHVRRPQSSDPPPLVRQKQVFFCGLRHFFYHFRYAYQKIQSGPERKTKSFQKSKGIGIFIPSVDDFNLHRSLWSKQAQMNIFFIKILIFPFQNILHLFFSLLK